ncbi:MAG TPA: Gfo/Idh/MocA family oxidoreductase [Bacteroidales bacterium]|nr:Gfo/Idh/MocA family oxidoreductase [Bacteroidales bacterium]HQM69288.1 Gfo/Idh/MocA family oxidoreductase [Bacteroidales bacterium]
MKKFNVGIIGYSWAAGAHIEAINKTSLGQVTAICSSRNLDPQEIKARHGGTINLYTDLNKMLADKTINVVSICSYPSDHAKQAIAAAGAGKHIIIEKPLALSWEDCLAVNSAVKKAGVRTCICFECRFSSQLTVIKSVIDQGLLGKIHYGEVDYYHGVGPWYGQFRWNIRKDTAGSSLLSAGCHALDALLLCMGSDFESVSSYSARSENADFSKYEYPTSSVTIIKFRNGTVGKVASVIDCFQPYYFHFHLVGSEGSLLDNKFYSTRIKGLNKNKWNELSMKLLDSGDVSDHPYQAQFEAFFNAIEANTEMPLTSIDDALKTHEVIFAADKSAEMNG